MNIFNETHLEYDRMLPGYVHCNCPIGETHDKA